MDLVFLLIGLSLLIGAGDFLVRGAVGLSLHWGIPAVVIGATIVGFGTSAPELLISIQAALDHAPGIVFGNIVGSNIANILLVLGIPALCTPLAGCNKQARRNLFFLIAATALFSGFVFYGFIGIWGGIALVLFTAIMVWDSIRSGLDTPEAQDEIPSVLEDIPEVDPRTPYWKLILMVAVGLIGLPIGAHLLIEGARSIALALGVSETVIGLTLVAVGTSLPELATSTMAAIRGQADVAIGNVVGSNIFNITGIIGIAALFAPLPVPSEIMIRDIWVMLGATVLLLPIVYFCIPLTRKYGLILIALYGLYVYVTFSSPL